MKKLKIRFVCLGKDENESGVYYAMQRKYFLIGWRTLRYTINMGYGSVVNPYTEPTKDLLLSNVLKDKYKTCKDFVHITEYPMIKEY